MHLIWIVWYFVAIYLIKKRKDCVFYTPLIKRYVSKTGFMQDKSLYKCQNNSINLVIIQIKNIWNSEDRVSAPFFL